jgi:hypothetical protein
MGKKSGSGYGIRILDEHPGSYFRELSNNFLGKNTYLYYLMWIRNRDPDSFRPWIRDPDGKIRIRDKHPGFATLN